MKELFERENGLPQPSQVKKVYEETLHLDELQAAEMYNKIWLKYEGTIKPVGGQLHRLIMDQTGMTAEQSQVLANELRPHLSAVWKKAKEEGRSPTRKEIMDTMRTVTNNEFATKLFGALYKISGGSSESMIRVFFKAFFAPTVPQTFKLIRPGKEETTTIPASTTTVFGGKEIKHPERKVTRPTIAQTRVQLSKNPIRAGFQKFLYEYGINRAPQFDKRTGRTDRFRARFADKKFEFHREERQRLHDYVQSQYEQKGLIEDDPLKPSDPRGVGAYVDTMNQAAVLMALYTKVGYLPPNLVGQVLFNTIDVAWNPIALARSYKFSTQIRRGALGEELTQKMRLGMGSGMYESIRPQRGAIKAIDTVSRKFADTFSKILDTPFRDAAFYNEAYRMGYRTVGEIRELLKAEPGSPLYEDLISTYQNANRNIVDYARMNKAEKTVLKRIVFFYPWIKGSTVYTARFASEHPFQFTAATQSARIGQEKAEEILGEVPSYLKGLIPTGTSREVPGLGRLPNVVNPQALSIFGSAGQAVEAARGFAFGDVKAGEQLSEYFTPAVSAAIGATTRVNPFTGARYAQDVSPLEIAGGEFAQTLAPLRTLKKIQEARKVDAGEEPNIDKKLFPASPGQEALAYFLGTAPRTYNVREGQSRAAAEEAGLQSKADQIKIKWQDRTRVASDAAKKVGVQMTGEVAKAFQTKADRASEYEALASSLGKRGNELNQLERLQADMSILVRQGIYTEQDAKDILTQYSLIEDRGIEAFRTKLHYTYLNQGLLHDWKAQAVRAGADPKEIDTDL